MEWDTLLQDLIDDLFKLEIDQYIDSYFHYNVSQSLEDEKKKKERFCR